MSVTDSNRVVRGREVRNIWAPNTEIGVVGTGACRLRVREELIFISPTLAGKEDGRESRG